MDCLNVSLNNLPEHDGLWDTDSSRGYSACVFQIWEKDLCVFQMFLEENQLVSRVEPL